MRRSRRTNTLVLISDHTKSYYEDKWEGNIFHYTGMGLTGDQRLDFSQNKTLAESSRNGVDVYLFEVFEKGKYVYQGQVELISTPYEEDQYDFNGEKRSVWIFPLKQINLKQPVAISEQVFHKKSKNREQQAKKLSEEELIKRVSIHKPKKVTQRTVSERYVRNEYIAEFVKRRANGSCQLCGNAAPFMDKTNRPFLEVHHINWLSKNGRDSVDNAAALCPNCHRKMHILDLKEDRERLHESARLGIPEE